MAVQIFKVVYDGHIREFKSLSEAWQRTKNFEKLGYDVCLWHSIKKLYEENTVLLYATKGVKENG